MVSYQYINIEDVHLATVRIYIPDASNKKRVLILPSDSDPANPNESPSQQPNRPVFESSTKYVAMGPESDCYELDMVNDNVENQIVVAERPKDLALSMSTTSATRARTTILTGRIKHECNLRPAFTQNYRYHRDNTPMRQIRNQDAGVPGGIAGVNRLSSGVGLGAGGAFGDLIVSSSVPLFSSLI